MTVLVPALLILAAAAAADSGADDLRRKAEAGDSQAQYAYGNLCYYGRDGVRQDFEQAAAWYRRAADRGFAKAQNDLGTLYESGRGVSRDHEEAVRLYRKAAEQGNRKGQLNLGRMYEEGKGVPRDPAKARRYYELAAAQGDAAAGEALSRLVPGTNRPPSGSVTDGRGPGSGAQGRAPGSAAVRIETLMTPELLRQYGLGQVSHMSGTPWGGLAMSSGEELVWSRGWISFMDPAGGSGARLRIDQFAFLPGGGLVAKSGDRLAYWKEGAFVPVARLPEPGLSIAANPQDDGSLFVYGGNSISILSSGDLRLMIETPGPVTAFAAGRKAIYYAAGGALYRQEPGAKPSTVLKPAPGSRALDRITSLALDEEHDRLYFSTDRRLAALKLDGAADGFLADGLDGALAFSDGRLFVLDRKTRSLFAVSAAD